MKCNIINETDCSDLQAYYPSIRYYYRKAFKVLALKDNYELSLIIVDAATIQKINCEYRHLDKETDVISFAEIDGDNSIEIKEDDAVYLGDIFINEARVRLQAAEYGHSVKREFVFLFVHGLLHCLGYDHMKTEDERIMIEKQKQIIGRLR